MTRTKTDDILEEVYYLTGLTSVRHKQYNINQ